MNKKRINQSTKETKCITTKAMQNRQEHIVPISFPKLDDYA